jgi:small-conductance mechanosensitive channel
METLAPYSRKLHEQLALVIPWMYTNVIAWSTVAQLCVIAASCMLAWIFSRRMAAWLHLSLKNNPRKSVFHIYASYRELFFLTLTALFLWLAALLTEGIGLPYRFLWTMASLTTAWAVIRLTSSTLQSPFWSRLIAVTLWIMAALNIVGWLGTTIMLMDKTAFTIGTFKLSLLLIVKSVAAFVVLLWAIRIFSTTLERSFMKAQGLTPSQRVLFYKLSNLTLYAVGGLVALKILGLDLTTFAVFSGALGLGIGFGLQKVFSNLISGIILLLDKSVKPGDVIAIGNTYGWVNSLGARCVSVLTRDGKEHLIPNENLITQEVENWSYSDQNIRIHVPIGVGYASDIPLVKKLLLQTADEHPRILKNPKPVCLITGFGDSSIDHELRAWINDPQDGVANIKSDIYYRIWELFKEQGIEVPFTQRDIHIKPDSIEALRALLLPQGGGPKGENER